MNLRVLDLFSGIGGFSLGLERTGGFETVAFCEIDPFCQKVLKKHWPEVPIFNDVRALDYDGPADVITGGYPCQPFSHAGKRQGTADDRHLWPAMFGLIEKYRPAWVIGENVAGHISMGLDAVLSDLESAGYTARTFVIPACAVDARHRRDRVWIVAHSEGAGKRGEVRNFCEADGRQGRTLFQQPHSSGQDVANTNAKREPQPQGLVQEIGQRAGDRGEALADSSCINGQGGVQGRFQENCAEEKAGLDNRAARHGNDGNAFKCSWPAEPDVGRVAHGVPRRVDRLRALGNAVVPQIPEMIGYAILQAEAA